MNQARLAFVGAASAASPSLLRSIAAAATFEAVCGDDAERLARRHHARWTFKDLLSLLRECAPDGVVLAVPYHERRRRAQECLSAGAAVLIVGSPGSAAACRRLHHLAKLAGRIVVATPAIRWSAAVQLAHRLIASGRFGAPVSVALDSTWPRSPHGDDADAPPVTNDQVFEAVDVVRHLAGPIRKCCSEQHDAGVLFASGAATSGAPIAMALHAIAPGDSMELRISIRDTDGRRLVIEPDGRLICETGSRVDAAHRPSPRTADPAVEFGHAGLVADFCRRLNAVPAESGLLDDVGESGAAAEAILTGPTRRRAVSV